MKIVLWGKHQRNFATAELFCATVPPLDIVIYGFGFWWPVRQLQGYFLSEERNTNMANCDI